MGSERPMCAMCFAFADEPCRLASEPDRCIRKQAPAPDPVDFETPLGPEEREVLALPGTVQTHGTLASRPAVPASGERQAVEPLCERLSRAALNQRDTGQHHAADDLDAACAVIRALASPAVAPDETRVKVWCETCLGRGQYVGAVIGADRRYADCKDCGGVGYVIAAHPPHAVPDETREAVVESIRKDILDAADDSMIAVAKVDDAGFEYTCQLCSVADLRLLLVHPPRAGEVTVTEEMVETMDSLAGSLCEALATAFPQGRHSAEHPCAYCKARVRNAFPQFVPAEEVVALLEEFGAHEYGCSAQAREIPEDDRTCVCGYGDTLARFRALGRPS